MDIQWFIKVISNEFLLQTIVAYGIEEIIDSVKNKLINKKIPLVECQLYSCIADALKDTCDQLKWEYDITTIAETVIVPLTMQGIELNKEYLFNIFSKYIGHPICDNDLEQWVNCFLFRLSSDEYTQLREYLKLRRMVDSKNNPISLETVKDDYNEYINNFQKKMFWGRNTETSLENLYVWNSYCIGESLTEYQDLENLFCAFLDDNIDEFLSEKNAYQYDSIHTIFIQGYPGCGKTSLVTKLTSLYAKYYSNKYKIYLINMAKFSYRQISLENIANKLNISLQQLQGCILILDSLDEALKNVNNMQEPLENLVEDLYDLDCKSIITCRSNLIEENIFRHCLGVSLLGFRKIEAKEWLYNYYSVNEDFNVYEWKKRIDIIDNNISKIVFIPLILYICVVRDINIDNVKSIGQLYDILFDMKYGQVAIPPYRKRTNHKSEEWSQLRELTTKISILMYQRGIVTINEIQQISLETNMLEKYFGLDFYVEQTGFEVKFVHSSIWQYFVAERLYKIIVMYEEQKDTKKIMSDFSNIFVMNNSLDEMILTFLNYFMCRDAWRAQNIEDYINLLMGISDYCFTQKGDKFEWIATFFREIFKIITLIIKKNFHYMLRDIFPKVIVDKYRSLLIKYTNTADISPIVSLKEYRLVECHLDGVNLAYTNLMGCVIRNSSFRNACFKKALLKGTYADCCDFLGTDFQYADLKNIDFSNSILCGCNFRYSRLNGANFSNTKLDYADLRDAKIEKINLKNAKINNCKIDISQMRALGLEKILYHDIRVYEGDKVLTTEEMEIKYKELNPVSYALWKKNPL